MKDNSFFNTTGNFYILSYREEESAWGAWQALEVNVDEYTLIIRAQCASYMVLVTTVEGLGKDSQ